MDLAASPSPRAQTPPYESVGAVMRATGRLTANVNNVFGNHRDEETFERAIAMYLGQVLVRNAPPYEWFVTEFAFEQDRYEIGVRRPLNQVMLSRLSPAPRQRNRRERSIWRAYQKHSRQRDAR